MKYFVLISYDLADDRTRTRLAKTLKDFGKRVQYSVFEGELTAQEMELLAKKLDQVKLGKEDSIRLYTLCKACVEGVKIWGTGELMRDPKYVVI